VRHGLIAAGLLASCASPGAPPRPDPLEGAVPAVIVHPTPQSRAALLQAVTDALGAQPLLAEDALVRESVLIIERRHLEGREQSMPERFRLFKVADQCVLVHERTGRRSPLVETRCAEAPAPVPK
jgi:hypothetical protein